MCILVRCIANERKYKKRTECSLLAPVLPYQEEQRLSNVSFSQLIRSWYCIDGRCCRRCCYRVVINVDL